MIDDTERLRRWRLVLGGGDDGTEAALSKDDKGVDAALAALYDSPESEEDDEDDTRDRRKRTGGLGGSAPRVARWLGDIRKYFPSSVVQVMQRDAVDRLGLTRLLLEPELLAAVEPDVHLVGTLLALRGVMPEHTKQTAREVIAAVVAKLEKRLAERTRSAVRGALDRATRVHRPRHTDIDWDRTIRANLRHFSPTLGTIVPERLIGYGRRTQAVHRDIILAVDQSGSMAESVVYAGVCASALASMRTLRTHLVVFDTEVVDLTEALDDPVDLLLGTQLGGGTDINRALAYCQTLVTRPTDTLLILITDLYESGPADQFLRRAHALVDSGVQMVCLLALSDSGTPSYDHDNAATLHELGVPTFACTPDLFPDLMAAAIKRQDLGQWAATQLTQSGNSIPPIT